VAADATAIPLLEEEGSTASTSREAAEKEEAEAGDFAGGR
jgi:hypothetical protein